MKLSGPLEHITMQGSVSQILIFGLVLTLWQKTGRFRSFFPKRFSIFYKI